MTTLLTKSEGAKLEELALERFEAALRDGVATEDVEAFWYWATVYVNANDHKTFLSTRQELERLLADPSSIVDVVLGAQVGAVEESKTA
jgi:hypothetical protein